MSDQDRDLLLRRLRESGVDQSAIDDASRTGRYATLAVEVALGGYGRHSLAAVARESGLSRPFLKQLLQAV